MRLLPLLSGAILVSLAHGIPQQRRHTRQTDESNGDVCMSKECILASASLFNNMNLNVKPCDNFYEFACGGFVENEVTLHTHHLKAPSDLKQNGTRKKRIIFWTFFPCLLNGFINQFFSRK